MPPDGKDAEVTAGSGYPTVHAEPYDQGKHQPEFRYASYTPSLLLPPHGIEPTPFGEWHISVTGDGLDLSGVTRAVIQLVGSVIPRV